MTTDTATHPATGDASLGEGLYDILTGDQEGRVCRDIPDEACNAQPGNFVTHVASLGLTKTGDGLADPKLVLAWLLEELGAPAAALGFLVPVREAGALLPQLVTAAWIRSRPQRKWVWAAGSAVQGLSVIGMAAVALGMTEAAAGWTIIALLALFALARSVCSVAYKDVLGKTVSKATRGTATGTATSASAAAILAFGALLAFGIVPLTLTTIAVVLVMAGAAWLASAMLFATLKETAGATGGGGSPLAIAAEQARLLRADPQLVRFIATRGLLIGTALSPPYMLAMAGESVASADGPGLEALGPFVLASGLAAILSAHVWGRMSDRSSRQVLMLAALVGAAANAGAAALGLLAPALAASAWALPTLLSLLALAHQGVRLGRSTHVVDMADRETRAAYTALSNTIIGVVLLAGGAFGFLAQALGSAAVLVAFAMMCLLAFVTARDLEEVQAE